MDNSNNNNIDNNKQPDKHVKNVYEQHDYELQQIESDQKQAIKFLQAFKRFALAKDYDEKLAIMKELWGDIQEPSTIVYTNQCKVTITIDQKKVYHFNFDCQNLDAHCFLQEFPESKENIIKAIVENEEKRESLKVETTGTVQDEKYTKQVDDIVFQNIYNGVKINTRKTQETAAESEKDTEDIHAKNVEISSNENDNSENQKAEPKSTEQE